MHEPPILIVMAKAPVCGAVKSRLAREIGAAAAAALHRTLCAAMLREAARDARFRVALAVSPQAALHEPYLCWRIRGPGTAITTPHPRGKGLPPQPLRRRPLSRPDPLADADIPKRTPRQDEPARGRNKARSGRADIVRVAQRRGGLGQRMQGVFDTVGRGPLIIVGTDIPFVKRDGLARAFQQLRGADAVFGPAEDGGYWLVGLRRRPKTLAPFGAVRWSSPHALADTLANLGGRRVAFAAILFDIDTGENYRRFQRARYR
jgi:glycosyltransferase A (GT-A) superfamily protein (DUF2064 family)